MHDHCWVESAMRIRNAGKDGRNSYRRPPKFARRHNVVAASLSRGDSMGRGAHACSVLVGAFCCDELCILSPICYAGKRESQCANHSYSAHDISSRSSRSRLQNPARSMRIPGSTRLQRVGRGILPRRTFLCVSIPSVVLRKSSRSQNAIASTLQACAPQTSAFTPNES